MKKILFIFTAGLIPLWVALAILTIRGFDLLTGFIFAFFMYFIFPAFIIAIITATVYEKNEKNKRFKVATAVFFSGYLILCLMFFGFLKIKSKTRQAKNLNKNILEINYLGEKNQIQKYKIIDKEQLNILENESFELSRFVRKNPEILKHSLMKIYSTQIIERISYHYNDLPSRYVVLVSGLDRNIFPVIDVNRKDNATLFSLTCFASYYQQDTDKIRNICKN